MIHFEKERWDEIRKNYKDWWDNKGERSLVRLTIPDYYEPDRPMPKAPLLSQETCTDLSWTAEEIIDTIDWHLSQQKYEMDAFPFVNMDSFGPGVLAAFCGARLDNSSGAVWFFPEESKGKEIADIHVKYDPDNIWAKRIKDIYRAGMERWQGQVLMGMPDLGGHLDIASILRGSEDLFMDLYDEPDEVKRLVGEIAVAWKEAYDDFNSILQPTNPGFSDWTGIYSATPSYVLQSDFSYMTSTDMFVEFALPELKVLTEKLDHSIYHLDGIGQIPHLDKLLELESLNAVQWIYGEGQPTARHWQEVYEKIRLAGKSMQLVGDAEDFNAITGLGNTVYFNCTVSKEESETFMKSLKS